MANKFISFSLKEINLKDEEGERTVEVSEDVLNQPHAAHNFQKKRKELYMLSKSKELGMIKRKRKKSFKSFYPLNSNEERKEQSKKEIKNRGWEQQKNNRMVDIKRI